MSASQRPVFAVIAASVSVSYGTAETGRSSPTNIQDIITGRTDGTLIHGLCFKATGTTTAGMIRIWRKVSSTYYLIDEVPVSAITPSATVAAWQGYWVPPVSPFVLSSGQKLAFTTHNAETFNCDCHAGSFS